MFALGPTHGHASSYDYSRQATTSDCPDHRRLSSQSRRRRSRPRPGCGDIHSGPPRLTL